MLTYAAGAFATATGTIVPVDGGKNNQFDAWSPAQVDFVADVVGYFKAPSGPGNYFAQGVATGVIRMYGGPFGGGGCLLSSGAAGWQCSSDRNLKENFKEVDAQESCAG
jgi:hypothetical protein